jgi:hypothetical protein
MSDPTRDDYDDQDVDSAYTRRTLSNIKKKTIIDNQKTTFEHIALFSRWCLRLRESLMREDEQASDEVDQQFKESFPKEDYPYKNNFLVKWEGKSSLVKAKSIVCLVSYIKLASECVFTIIPELQDKMETIEKLLVPVHNQSYEILFDCIWERKADSKIEQEIDKCMDSLADRFSDLLTEQKKFSLFVKGY